MIFKKVLTIRKENAETVYTADGRHEPLERNSMGKNVEEENEYKYYSTQMPVDLWTYPDTLENPMIRYINYDADTRIPVSGELFKAWGEVIYKKPLTEKQLSCYYLEPSRNNPDIKEIVYQQTQVIGTFEVKYHMEDSKRLTCWCSDSGSYCLKYLIPLCDLARDADDVRLYEELVNSGKLIKQLPNIIWPTGSYTVGTCGSNQ